MGAKKNDNVDGKIGTAYIHPAAQYQLGLVLEAGATKYGEWNYMSNPGHKASQLVCAIKRHIDKYFYEGQDFDKDTSARVECNVHHLACAMAGINMLLAQIAEGSLQDDRPPPLKTPTTKLEMSELFGTYNQTKE